MVEVRVGSRGEMLRASPCLPLAPESGMTSDIVGGPFRAHSVAKIVLQEMSKILRAAGAFFV